MAILLFDIDGTLVRTGGAGKAAMETGLRSLFGITEVRDVVAYSGRTDRAIARDLLVAHGIEPTRANQERLHEAYLSNLPDSLKQIEGKVCPGIADLLNRLHGRTDTTLGLLTGNVRRGARHKLGHFGLWDYFVGGGFGDEHYERDDVARSAIVEMTARLKRSIAAEEVWVIGDTPLDVQCARAIGARVVAVATGWHPLDELANHKPDVLLSDLSEYENVLKLWC